MAEHRREFARIEDQLRQLQQIVLHHQDMLVEIGEILARLPDSIQQKIGFNRK